MPPWIVQVVTMVAACIAAFTAYKVQRWRYRLDRLSAFVSNLCTEINGTADAASKYWIEDGKTEESRVKIKAEEVLLVGRQMRISQLLLALKTYDIKLDLTEIEIQVVSLFDALTGGSFKVSGRLPDEVRATQAQSHAAIINGELHRSLARRLDRWF